MRNKAANYTLGQTAEIFSKLNDDTSRDYFTDRLRYLLDDNREQFCQSVLRHIPKVVPVIPDLRDKEVVIYGFGNMARELNESLIALIEQYHNCKIVAFIDTFISTSGAFHSGVPIITKAEFNNFYAYATVVIATPTIFVNNYISLIESGFPAAQISSYMPYELLLGKMYLDESIIGHCDDEVYIDCGVLNGESIFDFSQYTKFKKAIGFEPDPANFQQSKQNLARLNIEEIEIIPKGAWSIETELSFNIGINGSSGVKDVSDTVSANAKLPAVEAKTEIIAVTSIDNAVIDECVTFIKMDVEGSELEALRGAANTIKRDKPRLAISLYHKPEDIIEIPQYISELVPEYKFYIRHYSYGLWKTVLYAVE
jgi:FkbM family methyltransferase